MRAEGTKRVLVSQEVEAYRWGQRGLWGRRAATGRGFLAAAAGVVLSMGVGLRPVGAVPVQGDDVRMDQGYAVVGEKKGDVKQTIGQTEGEESGQWFVEKCAEMAWLSQLGWALNFYELWAEILARYGLESGQGG